MTNIIQLSKEDLREVLEISIREILQEIKSEPQESEINQTGGIDLACEVLNRSPSWIYKATSSNRIPFKKFGSSVVFNRADLLVWMEARTTNPKDIRDSKMIETLQRSANKKLK